MFFVFPSQNSAKPPRGAARDECHVDRAAALGLPPLLAAEATDGATTDEMNTGQ